MPKLLVTNGPHQKSRSLYFGTYPNLLNKSLKHLQSNDWTKLGMCEGRGHQLLAQLQAWGPRVLSVDQPSKELKDFSRKTAAPQEDCGATHSRIRLASASQNLHKSRRHLQKPETNTIKTCMILHCHISGKPIRERHPLEKSHGHEG